ncbi:putative tellurite resistance protein B-like protein [Alkalispirillum mobile]|uniref:Putative tellurite resistance protein B-like protein n=1 Tax=Alkalispirillum mobile TaxID=85925 RepID=A0A498BTL1_9GAMM|nr:TerB family tellurite resistance protein [Alkalispirillum mobile]RLK47025.1 putative tellurite resistance protein B-like protein [Alkalispirillum mobile]
MLEAIKRYFNGHIAPAAAPENPDEHAVHLAAAALLLEMARMDGGLQPVQREAAERAVRDKLDLTAEESRDLIALADAELAEAMDYFQFTSLIKDHFDYGQRVRLIEYLWQVALADARLHHDEEHLVRRVAELIYVRHADFINARLRAEQQPRPD